MDSRFTIDRLAFHHIDKTKSDPDYADSEKDIKTLHPDVLRFFEEKVEEVWDAPNQGSTRSAKYVEDGHPTLKATEARVLIAEIVHEPDSILENSKKLAALLLDKTPKQAPSGLLAVLRLLANKEKRVHVVILKIHHDNENIIRILDQNLTQIEVETVKNALLKGIQKGACIPHPHRDDYDLKIIDRQLRNDPAIYFTEQFLGCTAKKSDFYQIKNLLPVLSRYAREKKINIANEKLPTVIDSLQKQDQDITTDLFCKTVQQQAIYSEPIDPVDFVDYIDKKSPLGPINIPYYAFAKTGDREIDIRHVTIKFRDPQLRDITLEGPPAKLQSIMTVDNGAVTFTLKTTSNGYTVNYD